MKKILALLLALLMITTVALVACKKKDTNNDPDLDEDDEYNNVQTTDAESDNESESETETQTQTPVTHEWVAKNDTVYVGMNNTNLRTEPNTTSNKVSVNSGTKLTRVRTNGVWDEVKKEGSETLYYVRCDLVTTLGGDFTFNVKETPVTLTVVGENKFVIRSTPFDAGKDSEDYRWSNVAIWDFDAADGTLKKVAVSESGNWYQVSYTGTIGTTTYNGTEKLYIHKNLVSSGVVSDPDVTSGGSSGGLG